MPDHLLSEGWGGRGRRAGTLGGVTTGSESTPAATETDGGPPTADADASARQAEPVAGPAPTAAPVTPWLHGLRPSGGEILVATRLVLVLLLAGIPLGVLWWLAAPRRSYEVSADGAFAIVPESEAAVGSDGWFLLLTAAVALVAAVVAWRREAQRGPLMAGALAVGMLLCGLVTWQVGGLLGPRPSAAELAEIGAVVLGPLGLRAYGVLVVGPFLAVAGYLLAVCFAPRDDLRAAGSRRHAAQPEARAITHPPPAPEPPPSIG